MKLTKSAVDRATYEGKKHIGADGTIKWSRYVLWDDEVRGFGLRITPAGKKSFILSYRIGARKRLYTIGAYGVLTLQEARDRAKRKLAAVLEGRDPLAERHAAVKKKASSTKTDKQMLRDYILPQIGSLRIADVRRQDIASLHNALRTKPFVANRVLALVSKMFHLAEKWGARQDGTSLCRHVEKFKEPKRERYLSTEDFQRLTEALIHAEEEGAESPHALAAIRLLILTGCRLREILNLRWEDVDFEKRVLHLPDSKTGVKDVYLSEPACQILRSLPRTLGNPHVIEGRKQNSHLSDLKGPWLRLRKQAELEDLRIHDLRHSFAAVGAGLGLSLPMIGKLLGHTQPRTTARYAHLAADPMHQAVDRVGSAMMVIAAKKGEADQNREPAEPKETPEASSPIAN